jgi:hypothetical protein
LHFEKQTLKPVFHFIGARVETRRLSSYGSSGFNLYSNLYSPAVEVRGDAEREVPGEVVVRQRVAPLAPGL